MTAIPFRSVVGSALAAGCCSWSVRSSRLSWSGSVVVALFSSFARASAFAAAWACRGGAGFCAVRRGSSGFAVSVPCAWR